MTLHDVSAVARGETPDPAYREELARWWQRISEDRLGTIEGVDATDLSQAGWGVVFPRGADPGIREALGDLLVHRREQASRRDGRYYREFSGETAYRAGESKQGFLARHGADPGGAADPRRVPYYLLLVGDPETIPYRFQTQLDVQYAVGRVYFDSLEEYARYARAVVDAEKTDPPRRRRLVLFGPRTAADRPTQLSADHLVTPLADALTRDVPDWTVDTVLGESATKGRLGRLLGGDDTPGLLFTASHGMGFPAQDSRQEAHQGALLCQDWPGPLQWRAPIPPDFYFAADDLGAGARLRGLVVFFFACYGAGTPRFDEFAFRAGLGQRATIAPRAFLSRLPQRMLAHPAGGALAVVGHIERAWGCSFWWPRAGEQIGTFQSTLRRLLEGHPVGSALEPLNLRFAALASDLSAELEEIKFGKTADDLMLAGMWTASNDARNYVLLGDPAVRLPGASPARGAA